MEGDGQRFICSNCGYVYVPERGDPAHGIPAGTPFEDIPDDWKCPLCYRGIEFFDPYD